MKKILKVVKSKYFIAFVIFAAIFLFFDENNLLVTLRLRKEVSQLERQAQQLEEGIVADSLNAIALKNNRAAIERYGREQYYMKRADEDIYIIK